MVLWVHSALSGLYSAKYSELSSRLIWTQSQKVEEQRIVSFSQKHRYIKLSSVNEETVQISGLCWIEKLSFIQNWKKEMIEIHLAFKWLK